MKIIIKHIDGDDSTLFVNGFKVKGVSGKGVLELNDDFSSVVNFNTIESIEVINEGSKV